MQTQMRIHRLSGYIQTIYLVEYPDKLLLLDGACRPDVQPIVHFIRHTLQRHLSDLKCVVVTHMHPDHAGGAHLLRRLSGCTIVSAQRKKAWYGGLRGFMRYFSDIAFMYWVIHRIKKPWVNVLYFPYLRPDITLGHQDTLPEFPDWQVLETPGHTDRDLSLYHPTTQTAYLADLIIRLPKRFVSPFPVTFPVAYRASLRQIQALPVQRYLLAHGGEVHIEHAIFDQLFNHTSDSPKNVRTALRYKKWGK